MSMKTRMAFGGFMEAYIGGKWRVLRNGRWEIINDARYINGKKVD